MKNYLSNWNLMRVIRLALGIIIIMQGVDAQQWMLVGLGGLFTLMPLLNVGCCGITACNTNYSRRKSNNLTEITCEEVK